MKQAAVFFISGFCSLWAQERLQSRFDEFRVKEQYAEMVKLYDQSHRERALNPSERAMMIEAYYKLHEYAKALNWVMRRLGMVP